LRSYTHRSTGNTAINHTIDPGRAFQLEEFRIHLNAVGAAGDLILTLDANAGSAYDVVLYKQDMTSVTDIIWQPDLPLKFDNGDKIVVAWANAGGKTYGIEMKVSP
jgi:hypothetical protein